MAYTPLERRSIVLGLLATVAITFMFWVTDADLALQCRFTAGSRWPIATSAPIRALHVFGTWPGIGLLIVAALMVALSARWRSVGLYLLLVGVAGAGIVTNVLGKALCGRPRPDAVTGFGGSLVFLRPFELGGAGRGYAFLCGDASMGFLFVAFFFLLRGRARWLAFVGGMLLGLTLGLGRVAAGTHWLSDVLLDGTLIFVVAALLAPVAREGLRLTRTGWVSVAAGAALLLRFGTPVHKQQVFAGTPTVRDVLVRTAGEVRVARGDPMTFTVFVDGAGWPGAGMRNQMLIASSSGDKVEIRTRLRGYYWNVRERVVVTVPDESVRVRVDRSDRR